MNERPDAIYESVILAWADSKLFLKCAVGAILASSLLLGVTIYIDPGRGNTTMITPALYMSQEDALARAEKNKLVPWAVQLNDERGFVDPPRIFLPGHRVRIYFPYEINSLMGKWAIRSTLTQNGREKKNPTLSIWRIDTDAPYSIPSSDITTITEPTWSSQPTGYNELAFDPDGQVGSFSSANVPALPYIEFQIPADKSLSGENIVLEVNASILYPETYDRGFRKMWRNDSEVHHGWYVIQIGTPEEAAAFSKWKRRRHFAYILKWLHLIPGALALFAFAGMACSFVAKSNELQTGHGFR